MIVAVLFLVVTVLILMLLLEAVGHLVRVLLTLVTCKPHIHVIYNSNVRGTQSKRDTQVDEIRDNSSIEFIECL